MSSEESYRISWEMSIKTTPKQIPRGCFGGVAIHFVLARTGQAPLEISYIEDSSLKRHRFVTDQSRTFPSVPHRQRFPICCLSLVATRTVRNCHVNHQSLRICHGSVLRAEGSIRADSVSPQRKLSTSAAPSLGRVQCGGEDPCAESAFPASRQEQCFLPD